MIRSIVIASCTVILGVTGVVAQQAVTRDSVLTDSTTQTVGSDNTTTETTTQIHLALLTLFSRRNATLANQVGKGSGVHPGVEVTLWSPRVWGSTDAGDARSVLGITTLGLSGRLLGGGFSADSTPETPGTEAVGDVNNLDVELYVGRPILHGRLGYGMRSFTGSLGTNRWSYLRLGARSSFALGSSREFDVTIGATFYLGVSGAAGGSGREGETRLTFTPQCGAGTGVTSWLCRRLSGLVAYRFEQFTANASPTSGGNRPEEVSSVIVGIGIRPE